MATSRILLSPLDQLMPRTYTRIFLVFPLIKDDYDSFITSLQAGLEQTCSQLPYLTGKVVQSEDRGQLEVVWSDDASAVKAEMICKGNSAARSDRYCSFAELKAQGWPMQFFSDQICPVVAVVDHSTPGASADVLRVSWTPLDGGVVLLVCVHHAVMDGTGVGELIELLARNIKAVTDGTGKTDGLPDRFEPLKRYELLKTALSPDTSKNESSKPIELHRLLKGHPEYTTTPPVFPTGLPPPRTSKLFTFPINKLKETTERLAPLTISRPTTNTLLFALIWSCICRVRHPRLRKISDEDTTPLPESSKLGFAINGRRHLGPTFVERPYLGNCNLYGIAELTFNELTAPDEADLATTVNSIATAILKVTPQYIADVISIVDQVSDVRNIMPGWSFYLGSDLALTSWTGLDLYQADFGAGLGAPEAVRIPYAEFDGLVILLPRNRNGQGEASRLEGEVVEVVVMLREDDMAALERDQVWSRFCE